MADWIQSCLKNSHASYTKTPVACKEIESNKTARSMADHAALTSVRLASAEVGVAGFGRGGMQKHLILDDVLKTVLVDFHVRYSGQE